MINLRYGAHQIDLSKRVAVLMAVYNGGRFIDEQISSLANQTMKHIDVWASDDGSQDSSIGRLRAHADSWSRGQFEILNGPAQGYAENYRSLMQKPEIEADFYSFCDQDDCWQDDKLETAVKYLAPFGDKRPALYCGRTRLVDEQGEEIGYSPLFEREPGFRNAIVQSIAGGNTMVANRAAWKLMSKSARRTSFVSHDWWSYLIVSGAGGNVIYDPVPRVKYRQHSGNLIGDNVRWRSRFSRIRRLFEGQFFRWNERNLQALKKCSDLLSEDALKVLHEFESIRSDNSQIRSLRKLAKSGMYRQSAYGNLGLKAGVFFNKI